MDAALFFKQTPSAAFDAWNITQNQANVMKKTTRRDFFKTATAGGMIMASSRLWAVPRSPTAGIDIVNMARGNVTSKFPLADCAALMPNDAQELSNAIAVTSTYGVKARLFVAPDSVFASGFDSGSASAFNAKSHKLIDGNSRMKASAVISIDDIGAAIEELQKCAKTYGFAAASLPCCGSKGECVSSAKYAPILQKAASLNIPVFIVASPDMTQFEKLAAVGKAAYGLSDKSGLPENLRIILPYFGGTFPWAALRENMDQSKASEFYCIVGGPVDSDSFACIKNIFGTERFVFGSQGNPNYREALKNVERLSLSESEFNLACYKNAKTLFGIDSEIKV